MTKKQPIGRPFKKGNAANPIGGALYKYTGNSKQAPVNMRKEEHQFVIDGYQVEEVLKQIPGDLKIYGAQIKVYDAPKRSRIVVPNTLKKLGMRVLSEHQNGKEVIFTFNDTNKSTISRCVKEGCEAVKIDPNKAYFDYIVLSNGRGTVRFGHCTKEIRPDETDLRKKLRVLGATAGEGQVQSLISDVNANKYICQIREEAVKLVMCKKA